MTEDEEYALALARELHRGLRDMQRRGLLSARDIPDDYQWLKAKMQELARTLKRVDALDRKENGED